MESKTAYALALILLVLGIVVGYFAGGAGGGVQTVTVTKTVGGPGAQTVTVTKTVQAGGGAGLQGDVYVGALLPLTGVLSSFGENNQVALKLAEKEINEWLAARGENWRIKVFYEDTATDPKQALDKLQALHARGVKIFIGPMSSAAVKELKSYVDSNKLLVISQSSTSPALAIPNDMIYRFCPTDEFQGPAAAKALYDMGARYIVQVWRGDAWGDALTKAQEEAFKKLLQQNGEQGEVWGQSNGKGIKYDPQAAEFTAVASQLASAVQELVNKYGADKVGVYFVAFGEYVQFATAAAQYDILKKVHWVGSDGTALLGDVLTNEDVAKFAYETKFVSPIFGAPSPFQQRVAEAVKKELGRLPESYTYASYDALWAVALSLELVDSYDPVAVAKLLPSVVQRWMGATGTFELNENGDRAYSDYLFWMPVPTNGKYEWKLVGIYHWKTSTLTWEDWFLQLLGKG
ncbi:MAG: penicillin-binding protein activator [Candidatus Korarchaeota archaeon]|nr:penicillin-binding protein activator [Candidatus Korarchaeota archaeon]